MVPLIVQLNKGELVRLSGVVQRLSNSTPQLCPDFAGVDSRELFVQCKFIEAEDKKLEDIDPISTMMAEHEVTRADVWAACLRIGCCSTIPIKYAARFLAGFDTTRFILELIEVILTQISRGSMLQ